MNELLDLLDIEAVETDKLTDDQRDKARQVFVALMWRGLLRSINGTMELTAAQLECADATIQEWADAALGEAPRWTIH